MPQSKAGHPPSPPGIVSGPAENWRVGLGLYNILDHRANAAEFWYVDRLQGEPTDGVADLHTHPIEPRAVRLTLSKTF
jgi:hypothetical protein